MERIKNGVRKNLVLTYVDLPVNRQYLQRLGNSIIADLLGFSQHIKPGFNNQCLSIWKFVWFNLLVFLVGSDAALPDVGTCTFMEYFCSARKCSTAFYKALQKDSKANCV